MAVHHASTASGLPPELPATNPKLLAMLDIAV